MPSALRIKEIRDLEDNVMMQNGALTENVTFPAGHVVNTYTAGYMSGTHIEASMAPGGSSSNPDNLTHDVRFYTSNRVFVKLRQTQCLYLVLFFLNFSFIPKWFFNINKIIFCN